MTSHVVYQTSWSRSFGRVIRSARKDKGLSLKGLCDLLSVSSTYISNIELSKSTPFSVPLCAQAALALDLDPQYVLAQARVSRLAMQVERIFASANASAVEDALTLLLSEDVAPHELPEVRPFEGREGLSVSLMTPVTLADVVLLQSAWTLFRLSEGQLTGDSPRVATHGRYVLLMQEDTEELVRFEEFIHSRNWRTAKEDIVVVGASKHQPIS